MDYILEWIDFSVWLPSDLGFSEFVFSCFARMGANGAPTDFDEPIMAAHLREHIWDCKSFDNITSPWISGFGATPPGISTFVANSIERKHRTVKGLLTKS